LHELENLRGFHFREYVRKGKDLSNVITQFSRKHTT
jgi:hypothetical protein